MSDRFFYQQWWLFLNGVHRLPVQVFIRHKRPESQKLANNDAHQRLVCVSVCLNSGQSLNSALT